MDILGNLMFNLAPTSLAAFQVVLNSHWLRARAPFL